MIYLFEMAVQNLKIVNIPLRATLPFPENQHMHRHLHHRLLEESERK
jgi:hypothetical protein